MDARVLLPSRLNGEIESTCPRQYSPLERRPTEENGTGEKRQEKRRETARSRDETRQNRVRFGTLSDGVSSCEKSDARQSFPYVQLAVQRRCSPCVVPQINRPGRFERHYRPPLRLYRRDSFVSRVEQILVSFWQTAQTCEMDSYSIYRSPFGIPVPYSLCSVASWRSGAHRSRASRLVHLLKRTCSHFSRKDELARD